MGAKRKKDLSAGGKISLHIPADVNLGVIKFLNSRSNVNKTIFEILEIYINSIGSNSDFFDKEKLENNNKKYNKMSSENGKGIEVKNNINNDKYKRNDDSFETPDWL